MVSRASSTDLPPGAMPSGSEDGNRDCQYIAKIAALKLHPVSHDASLGTLLHRPVQPHFFSLLHHSTCHRDSSLPDRIAYALPTATVHQDAEGSSQVLCAYLARTPPGV
jgi:hypothetical protein